MPAINREWHLAHPMPKNPSLALRVAWHLEHAQACHCRPIPASVAAVLKAQGRA
jgi:hypothetical protein